MSEKNIFSHRGSKSEHASGYKKKGHSDEEDFARIIGGTVKKGIQKTDVIGPDGTIYSVKGGGLRWQIFLYNSSNFRNNPWGDLGNLFQDCLDCFPTDYKIYEKDKVSAKECIYKYIQKVSGQKVNDHNSAKNLDRKIKQKISQEMRDNVHLLQALLGLNNSYLNSKLKLKVVTKKNERKV